LSLRANEVSEAIPINVGLLRCARGDMGARGDDEFFSPIKKSPTEVELFKSLYF